MGSFQPWANPDPQSVFGLNSSMVYGENIQFSVGLNHQVAIGSNLQVCINPTVLFDLLGLPGTSSLSAFWGSGLGGNLQFTIGSNTNVTWGRQFTVNMGPEQVTMDVDKHKPFTMVMCTLIGAAGLAYAIAYGAISDEDGRATAVIIFQTAMDIMLATLMVQHMEYKAIDGTVTEGLKDIFVVPDSSGATTLQNFVNGLSAALLLGAVVVPPIFSAVEEGHFQGEQQDSSS